MPWWWLWLTAGVHRAAFGPRESLVESLVGELVALSGANGMCLGGFLDGSGVEDCLVYYLAAVVLDELIVPYRCSVHYHAVCVALDGHSP